jgi:hypothetical protein
MNHRQRILAHQPRRAGDAVHLGHVDVERDDVRAPAAHLFERVESVAGGLDLAPGLEEHHLERLAHEGRVVDHQNPGRGGHRDLPHRTYLPPRVSETCATERRHVDRSG